MSESNKIKKMNIMLDFNKKLVSKDLTLVDDIKVLNEEADEFDKSRLIDLFGQLDTLKGYDDSVTDFVLKEIVPNVTFVDNKYLECMIKLTVQRVQAPDLLKPAVEKSLKYDFKDIPESTLINFYSVVTNYCIYLDDETLTNKLKTKLEKLRKRIGE